jgi:hypothetical protein
MAETQKQKQRRAKGSARSVSFNSAQLTNKALRLSKKRERYIQELSTKALTAAKS